MLSGQGVYHPYTLSGLTTKKSSSVPAVHGQQRTPTCSLSPRAIWFTFGVLGQTADIRDGDGCHAGPTGSGPEAEGVCESGE